MTEDGKRAKNLFASVGKSLAVALIGGKQEILREGDILTVENLNREKGERVDDFKILFYGEGGVYSFGHPFLGTAKVEVEVLENLKGKKIDVIKFKAKSRYSKKRGYRSKLSRIKVLKISGGAHGA